MSDSNENYKMAFAGSFLCIGGVLYMHYTLGVYSPLTFMSAIKAGVPEALAIDMIQRANAYMAPLTWVLVGIITNEWGFAGSLESLFETTFFFPALLYWSRKDM